MNPSTGDTATKTSIDEARRIVDKIPRSPQQSQQVEMKFDGGKLLGSVIFQDFPYSINQVLGVATFGANKYARSSWKTVSDGRTRYMDALFRHILAAAGGEDTDAESGFPHLAHAAWNCLAVLQLQNDDKDGKV